jgi:hypothetical protein
MEKQLKNVNLWQGKSVEDQEFEMEVILINSE